MCEVVAWVCEVVAWVRGAAASKTWGCSSRVSLRYAHRGEAWAHVLHLLLLLQLLELLLDLLLLLLVLLELLLDRRRKAGQLHP